MPPAARPLPPALPGAMRTFESRAGRLAVYSGGPAPAATPLLLLHSINAAASAYEVHTLFSAMRAERPVYAVDLPGFGHAGRDAGPYTVGRYVCAVNEAADWVREETGEAKIDALALSLTGEFLARAAVARPDAYRRLALVSPTGFQRGSHRRRGPPGATRRIPGLESFMRFPLWSRGLFNLLTTAPSIRFFLQQTFGGRVIDEGLFAYCRATARAPGAEFAPWAFVSGKLFSRDIRAVYEAVPHPVWLTHGTRGAFRDFTEARWAKEAKGWAVDAFESGALPHLEHPAAFAEGLRVFLGEGPVARAKAAGDLVDARG